MLKVEHLDTTRRWVNFTQNVNKSNTDILPGHNIEPLFHSLLHSTNISIAIESWSQIGWFDWCLMSSEQFFSYIQDENI